MEVNLDNKNVYTVCETKIDTSQNMIFQKNMWLKIPILPFLPNPHLLALHSKGVAIWLSSKGEFCYRTSINSTIHTTSLKNINLILSNLLGYEIQVVAKSKLIKAPKKSSYTDQNPMQIPISTGFNSIPTISIYELLLVEDNIFNPLQPCEFFNNYGTTSYCRNTFIQSFYLQNEPQQNQQFNFSIILQYIYYLSNYNKDRFYFIMNWLASFFKNLQNKSKIALVLFGNEKSGKEIFFDEIIDSLFGHIYCLKITDTLLEVPSVPKLIKNKLFYNLDNISDSTLKDKKTKKLINDLLCKDTIEVIENQESVKQYYLYGQTIITVNEACIPYIDKYFESYSIFKIPDNIEQMYIPKEIFLHLYSTNQTLDQQDNISNYKISKSQLIHAIRNDLLNFALILKGHSVNLDILNSPFNDDDKSYIQNNLEDKLEAFHESILNHRTSLSHFEKIKDKDSSLYEEIISDFNINRIKQKNLIKCFALLYPEENITSSRTLMAQLRKIDNNFYKTSGLKLHTAGIKYFYLA